MCAPQMASRICSLFAWLTLLPKPEKYYDLQCFSVGQTTPKIAPSPWDLDPRLINGSLAPCTSAPPKWLLDRFSLFCRGHERDQQMDTPTDHTTPSVALARILCIAMRCGLIMHKFT